MPRPILQRGPNGQQAPASLAQVRFPLGLGFPMRKIHALLKTAANVALTEAQSEADVARIFTEMNGPEIQNITPARYNDLHRWELQALGGNVTDDGRYTIGPHRPRYLDELKIAEGGGLELDGPDSLNWGTGGLKSLTFVIECAATVSNYALTELYVEYDGDPSKQGEPPGSIWRERTLPQGGVATDWSDGQSIWKAGTQSQKLLEIHIILNSGVIDTTQGFRLKVNGGERIQSTPRIQNRKMLNEGRVIISGYQHVDFVWDGKISTAPNLGAKAGVTDALFQVNYSTAPTGNTNTMIVRDVVDWDEIKAGG